MAGTANLTDSVYYFTEVSNHTPNCDRYYFENRTYFLYNGYEGVPETLLINVIGWVALLILFTFLRKLAWDYGRIALVSRTEENRERGDQSGELHSRSHLAKSNNENITQSLEKARNDGIDEQTSDVVIVDRTLITEGENRYNVWTTLFYGDYDRGSVGSQESLDTTLRMQDKGILAWIPAFFKIKDADILRKCGYDAIQYIQFQRYLLVYLAIVCVLSVAIILPVNISDSNSNGSEFADTTISNVKPESSLLWIHAVFAVVYLLIAVYFTRRFSSNLEYDEDEHVSKTVMVSNIPKDKCFRSIILQHFQEAYPEAIIIDVQFAYNISKLVALDASRSRSSEARKMSEIMFKKSQVRPIIRPYTCGRCCCCSCCGCNAFDAIEYYNQEEQDLKEACEAEKAQAFMDPLGIAFITLDTDQMARSIRADFRAACKGGHNPQISSVNSEMDVGHWAMKYAPAPENIYWENLSLKEWKWWLRAIFINLILVILLFFFTTPTIIMNSLDELNFKKSLQRSHSPILVSFLPTILLWTFSALLPNIVYYSDQFVGHWTKTAEHHSVMRKTFIFLILMVVILPSLGLTSAKALFEWVVIDNTNGNKKYRWQCIFLAGNGAFFVNYVITSAFIGTALELIRFSQLFMYALKLLCSRSAAEKTTVRKSVVWDFQFGIQYAWMLCVFTIIMAYSIPCPLIMPFGMVYMALKHLVDRYNIFFAYAPSKIDKNIHTSAVTFVIAAVIFLQLSIVFFSALRTVELTVNPVFIFSAVALFITLVVFFGRIFFGWFKGLSPIKYKNAGRFVGSRSPSDENEPFSTKPESDGPADRSFVPSVLSESAMEDEEMPHMGTFTYGSTGSVNVTTDAHVETG